MRLTACSSLGTPFGAPAPVPGFASRVATLRERSDIGCLLVGSALDASRVASAAADAVGVDLPIAAGAVAVGEGRLALWLSPRSWLVHCPLDEEFALVARVNAAFPDKTVNAAHFTDYLCWLELRGEGAEDLLRQGGFLSLARDGLPVGHAKRTLIADVAAVVIRPSRTEWLVGIERSRSAYFSSWLASCARTETESEAESEASSASR